MQRALWNTADLRIFWQLQSTLCELSIERISDDLLCCLGAQLNALALPQICSAFTFRYLSRTFDASYV